MPVIASRLGSTPSSTVALVGAGDPGASRLVYSMVIGLVVIGLLLIVLGIWIVRQTRVDLDVLAPLERMGDGEWRKRDRSTQRRMLDEVRPEGASPLAPATQPPSLDDEFELAEHPVTTFSDLGPGVDSDERAPIHVGSDDDPVIEPSTGSETEPVVEPETEPSTGSETEPVVEPETEPSTGSETEPVVEPEIEPVPEPEPDSTPVEEPVPLLVVESDAEPVVDAVVEPDDESPCDPRA